MFTAKEYVEAMKKKPCFLAHSTKNYQDSLSAEVTESGTLTITNDISGDSIHISEPRQARALADFILTVYPEAK